jgi:antitoxin component of RelBE/YafQ-DinJ toxin-antitoxin module
MPSVRPPKKSEAIEVRLSYAAKTAFMARCQRNNRTASEAIRLFIEAEIGDRPMPRGKRLPHWRTLAAVAAGMALGVGAAAPSLAHATRSSCSAFHP